MIAFCDVSFCVLYATLWIPSKVHIYGTNALQTSNMLCQLMDPLMIGSFPLEDFSKDVFYLLIYLFYILMFSLNFLNLQSAVSL